MTDDVEDDRSRAQSTYVSSMMTLSTSLCHCVLEDLYTQMGFEFDCRPAFMRIPGSVSGTGEDKLLDFVARCPGDRDRSVGVDLTVFATMAAKYHRCHRVTPALAAPGKSRSRRGT